MNLMQYEFRDDFLQCQTEERFIVDARSHAFDKLLARTNLALGKNVPVIEAVSTLTFLSRVL